MLSGARDVAMVFAEREQGWARKWVGHLWKKRGKGSVGKKGLQEISASQQGRRITRISCHGSIETESRLVVTRGWREGWMGSDCLIASFWGDENVLEADRGWAVAQQQY